MKIVSSIFLAVIALVAVQTAAAQNEKDLVVRTAAALETAPLDKATASMSSDSVKYLIRTKDVDLIVCGGVFGLFADKKNKAATEMTSAYTIGMGAFKISHPDRSSDENAAQLAGLNLALKVYQAVVNDKPKERNAKIDDLIQKRDAGQLGSIVNGFDCGKK